jgi:hypothetical protein
MGHTNSNARRALGFEDLARWVFVRHAIGYLRQLRLRLTLFPDQITTVFWLFRLPSPTDVFRSPPARLPLGLVTSHDSRSIGTLGEPYGMVKRSMQAYDFIAHRSGEKEGVLKGLDHTPSIWSRRCGTCSYPTRGDVLLVRTFLSSHNPTAPARARDTTDSALPELQAPRSTHTLHSQQTNEKILSHIPNSADEEALW